MRTQFGVDLGQLKDIRGPSTCKSVFCNLITLFGSQQTRSGFSPTTVPGPKIVYWDVNIILTRFANHQIECKIFLPWN